MLLTDETQTNQQRRTDQRNIRQRVCRSTDTQDHGRVQDVSTKAKEPEDGVSGVRQNERNEVSEINQLIALREVAKTLIKQWDDKAKAQSHGALFHEDPSCRPRCLEHANLYHGRAMEARFWHERIQSAIFDDNNVEPVSTMVDKQAEATAAAVVLGEDKRSGTWFGCSYCGSAYDQSEANARLRVCCGALLTVHQGNRKQ